jgi:hypothetical protein
VTEETRDELVGILKKKVERQIADIKKPRIS